jgi:hypothetical protein
VTSPAHTETVLGVTVPGESTVVTAPAFTTTTATVVTVTAPVQTVTVAGQVVTTVQTHTELDPRTKSSPFTTCRCLAGGPGDG